MQNTKNRKITRALIVAMIGAGVATATTQALAKSHHCPVEKCYGVVKAGKNDCGTPKHACAAQAKRSSSKSEWMYVMKGNCTRIVGGSLTPLKK